MKTEDFDYSLPVEYIAQMPAEPRDHSRLLVLDRKSGEITHDHFYRIGEYLKSGDLLVINRTRVIPARLFGNKLPGQGRVEVLLLRKEDETSWECLVGGKGLKVGVKIQIEHGPLAEIAAVLEGSKSLVRFTAPIEAYFTAAGHVPLPPYIHNLDVDPERYQTVFNKVLGSAAAPTAGLHFTRDLMESLNQKDIHFAMITLHVGLDTFAPVTEANPQAHKIHQEWCELTEGTAEMINRTRAAGGRIV
ncbi:MAG: S-adenosylmethionine:tRNA ribosyltransferase-isomerase, partial [Anaerolineaceae bacterium]